MGGVGRVGGWNVDTLTSSAASLTTSATMASASASVCAFLVMSGGNVVGSRGHQRLIVIFTMFGVEIAIGQPSVRKSRQRAVGDMFVGSRRGTIDKVLVG